MTPLDRSDPLRELLEDMREFAFARPSPQQTRQKSAREMTEQWLYKLETLLGAGGGGARADQLKATEIVWPQEAEELIDMVQGWPLLTDDSGAMFSGDVLIHKLGNALRAALGGGADRQSKENNMTSERIESEITRMRETMLREGLDSPLSKRLYDAQQALSWALDENLAQSPYNYITGVPAVAETSEPQ